MQDIVCFIDDSEFEHDMVREEIAPVARDFQFVQTYTFDEARQELNGRHPSLFLLDLWGRDDEVLHPYIYPKEDILKRVAGFLTLEDVYDGLEKFEGDVTNEYLKRFFSIVASWRSLFEEVCDRIGQNGKYGLSNLARSKSLYPDVPAVFYTRKSLIRDAVAMFKAGADGLFIKPTGENDNETRRLTREYAPQLISELKEVIHSKAGAE
jgi:DNA-binding NarL/FixJ family response regulator